MIKIIFLLRFYPVYGGGEAVTIKLANEFIKAGFEVGIAYLWDSEVVKLPYIDSEVTAYKILENSYPDGIEDIRHQEIKDIQLGLKKIIRDENPQLIINQWLPPKIVFKANCGIAKIVSCRHAAIYINSTKWNLGQKILKSNFKKLLKQYYSNYYKYSDKWVLLCEQFKKEGTEIFDGDLENKIEAIYNPCRYDEKFHMEDYDTKENIVLYVGRIYKEKRVDLLIDIWKNIENIVLEKKWFFYIVGCGEQYNFLLEKIKSLDCQNIIMTGQQEPLEYYRKAKIFVSASETEGYPMTLIEAMFNGCVPIAMNMYSSLTDVIEEGCGIITEDNTEDFENKLVTLIQEEEQCKRMCECAIQSSIRFRIENVLKVWCELFQELLK